MGNAMNDMDVFNHTCPECGKEFSSSVHLENHFLSKHEESGDRTQSKENEKDTGLHKKRFDCSRCDKTFFKNAKSLQNHINKKHQGIEYRCNQCDYESDYKDSLTYHIQSKHENVRYYCDQCDKKFTLVGSLNKHIKSVHEGIQYEGYSH